MFKLIPQDKVFYDLFEKSADTVVKASEALVDLLNDISATEQKSKILKEIEHQGDEITHEIMERLHKSFITPIERGDIRRLVVALDDIIDFIESSANRLHLYQITEVLPAAHELAKGLVETTHALAKAVKEIRHLSKRDDILTHCVEVNRLENEADDIWHRALATLFNSSDHEPIFVMKWKEILQGIERAIDCCEDAADVVEGIVLENA